MRRAPSLVTGAPVGFVDALGGPSFASASTLVMPGLTPSTVAPAKATNVSSASSFSFAGTARPPRCTLTRVTSLSTSATSTPRCG